MHVKFTHFCITQPQFRRCLLFWFLLEKELFILKKEYLTLKERTQWLVKLSKLVPDTFCWLLLRKKKLTERRIYSSSVLDSVLLWGTGNEYIRWRIYSSSVLWDTKVFYRTTTHTMIENIFFEPYRIRKKLWCKCPWCKKSCRPGGR